MFFNTLTMKPVFITAWEIYKRQLGLYCRTIKEEAEEQLFEEFMIVSSSNFNLLPI